jgi:hypothetical protein
MWFEIAHFTLLQQLSDNGPPRPLPMLASMIHLWATIRGISFPVTSSLQGVLHNNILVYQLSWQAALRDYGFTCRCPPCHEMEQRLRIQPKKQSGARMGVKVGRQ